MLQLAKNFNISQVELHLVGPFIQEKKYKKKLLLNLDRETPLDGPKTLSQLAAIMHAYNNYAKGKWNPTHKLIQDAQLMRM